MNNNESQIGTANDNQQGKNLPFELITLAMLFEAAGVFDLDAAIRPLQDVLGIKTGDVAQAFFSGQIGEVWPLASQSQRLQFLTTYLEAERSFHDKEGGQVLADLPVPDAQSEEQEGTFVIYSAGESAANTEPMFWSNENGWGDLGAATRFTAQEKETLLGMPHSLGNDATWMSASEAFHGRLDATVHAAGEILLTIPTGEKECEALLIVLGSFMDNERAKGPMGIGPELLGELVPIETAVLYQEPAIKLTMMNLALVQRALVQHAHGHMDETHDETGLDATIAKLIAMIGERAQQLRQDASINTYTHAFQCRCPVNQKEIFYYLVIESNSMIHVEDIVANAQLHDECFHEKLADEFFEVFGGTQRLSAYHHGVLIKTIRKAG